jgi:hypothetical protein
MEQALKATNEREQAYRMQKETLEQKLSVKMENLGELERENDEIQSINIKLTSEIKTLKLQKGQYQEA